jgi:AcrR family transcriptional regulator
MDRISGNETRSRGRRPSRIGRPPRKLAGEVDTRILDAAKRAFLERGLAGASIDEIANLACAGKPTIYARFPNKEALYSAVVMRNVASVVGRFADHIPAGTTIEERLTDTGATFLDRALVADTVGLMRAVISEARRFPELANSVHRMARRHGEEIVGRVLGEVADGLGSLPAFAPERIATTTYFFVDLVFMPMIMRALFGEKLKSLRTEIGPHVARSVAFFLAACQHGDVN